MTSRAKQLCIKGDLDLKKSRAKEAEKHFRAALGLLRPEGSQEKYLSEEAAGWLGLARALEVEKKPADALAAADRSRHLLHELTVSVLPALPEPQQLTFLTSEDEPAYQASLA